MRLIFLILTFGACAKTASPVAATPDPGRPTPAAAEGAERPLLLWEVRKGDAVSTVMGTCHLSIAVDHALPPEHQSRLTDARIYVNEVDVGAMANPLETMPLVWKRSYDLRETLGAQDFHNVVVSMREVMPAPLLVHMRPWLAATSRMLKPNAADPILDGVVEQMARTAAIPQRALETVEQQVALMESFDDLFVTELRPLSDEQRADREHTVQALIKGCLYADLDAVEEAMTSESSSQMSPQLLDARNRNWADAVVEEAEAGGMFMAVGAGHMIGETGMLALLRSHDFEVTALTTTTAASTPPEAIQQHNDIVEVALPDPDQLSAFVAAWAAPEGPIAGLCADDQVVPQCFAPPAGATCIDAVSADAAMCGAAHFDLLPADPATPLAPDTAQKVFGCALAGSIMSAVAEERVGESPMCDMLMEKMAAASGAAVGAQ